MVNYYILKTDISSHTNPVFRLSPPPPRAATACRAASNQCDHVDSRVWRQMGRANASNRIGRHFRISGGSSTSDETSWPRPYFPEQRPAGQLKVLLGPVWPHDAPSNPSLSPPPFLPSPLPVRPVWLQYGNMKGGEEEGTTTTYIGREKRRGWLRED